MDYIDFEAIVWNSYNSDKEIVFSENLSDDKFIDDSNQKEEEDSPSFYRFVNLTRDTSQALNDDDKSNLNVRNLQSKTFYHIKREFVEFNEFHGCGKCANKFKEILCSFQGDLKDSFFMLCFCFFLSIQKKTKLIKKR